MMTKHDRLKALYLQKQKIEDEIALLEKEQSSSISFTKQEKIDIFRSLFVGRSDIYAKLWQSVDGSRKKYYPVTKTFQGEDYIPLSDDQIELHLRGEIDLASFLITYKNRSKFIVIKTNIVLVDKLYQTLKTLDINGYCEQYNADQCHIWIFFDTPIDTKIARSFGEMILKKAQIQATLLPKEDFTSQTNLGSMIAMPLQLKMRDNGFRIFVQMPSVTPIDDPWDMLNKVNKVSLQQIKQHINIDDIKIDSIPNIDERIIFPTQLELTLYDFIYIPLLNLSKGFVNRLKKFAMFDNPQIKILQSLRKPLYNTPRVLKGYEQDEYFLKLPRGLIYEIDGFLEENGVKVILKDKRIIQEEVFPKIDLDTKDEQQSAIKNIEKYDCCLCVAPPGFGKTFIGAKMIELRAVNTLVVVHKNMLLEQWIERFMQYFGLSKKEIGYLGKGKNRLNGKLDIATMQSLKNQPELIENYSQVIVDECHHLPAVTFEQIIKQFCGKYILGLSATPNRKDDLQPIIFQQIGPIAYEHKKKRTSKNSAYIIKSDFKSQSETFTELINEIVNDEKRNQLILDQIIKYKNRKVLVLTDRIEHISNLEVLCESKGLKYISVHGSLNKKQQNDNMEKVLDANLILATTSFFGEGIDFPHLDTIIFATPISYYGRLIQYLGRIGRSGADCLAIDILDNKNAMLNSTYKKRKPGYKQMHYSIIFE